MKIHEAVEQLENAVHMAKQLEKLNPAFAREPVKGALAALLADCQAVIAAAYEAEND